MKILEHQHWHILSLTGLLVLLYFFAVSDPTIFNGELFGISTWYWFVFALLSPVLHQFYVLVTWRSELYYKSLSKQFGEKGFKLFKIGFALLILSRPITITLLAFSSAFTIGMNTAFSYGLSAVLTVPAVYLLYSLRTYFGIDRAFGIDHFDPDKFKGEPMVNQGIFKYTPNAMYVVGFFILWIPGILLQSKAALALALFNHIYIWVHYYFTELPDMKVIYNDESFAKER